MEPEVSRCIHNSLQPVPVLNRTDPVHAFPSNFLSAHFNIIPTSTLDFTNGPFPSDIPTKPLCAPVLSTPCVPHEPPISVFSIWSLQ